MTKTRANHRHHRTGRVVSRRAAARKGLRGLRHGAPLERAEHLAHRASARSRHAEAGRSARSAVAAAAHRRGAAARALQPRGDVVRAGVVGSADADRRVQLAGRDPHARRGPPGRSDDPLLSGLVERDVRQGARGAADRADAVLSAQPVRRLEGVRALHHRELPRELQPVCRLGHAVQPRVAAARPGVRHAQGDRRRGAHQARAGRHAADRQPRCAARLGICRRLRARDVADAAAGPARRLRHRDRREPFGARAGRDRVRARRPRLAEVRAHRSGAAAAGRSRSSARRCDEGADASSAGRRKWTSSSWSR